MVIKKFKDSLMHLKIILEEMEKMKIVERLEIEKIEQITKEELTELEIKKIDELKGLDQKIERFGTIKNRFRVKTKQY